MQYRLRISWAVLSALALTLLGAGAVTAQQTQTQKTEVLMFEVISVYGNNLIVRDQNGTRELTVPDSFRFTVDGKPMSVHELTRGMKGTATVTTTTTVRPVYVTEVKKGVVTRQTGTSVSVRTEEGTRRFTQSELDKRGVEIYVDGKPTSLSSLQPGDQLTATIVTSGPPEVLTAKDVQATLAAPEAAPAPAAPAEAPPAAAEAPPAAAETAPAAAAETPPAAEAPTDAPATPAAATDEGTKPAEEQPNRRLLWIVLAAIVVIAVFLLMRKRRAQQ